MKKREFSDKLLEYSGDVILLSVLTGSAAGVIPVISAALCYAADSSLLFIGFISLIPMTLLLKSRNPVLCILKIAAAFTSYIIILPLTLFSGGFNYLFSLFNPSYGKPNAGDGFGLAFMIIPASGVLLLVSFIAAAVICFVYWLKDKKK